jgi:hypothetical protein
MPQRYLFLIGQSLRYRHTLVEIFFIEIGFCNLLMNLVVRPIGQNDADGCGKIGYEGHDAISSKHGYPFDQPSEEFAVRLIRSLLGNPNSWGFLAERQGNILGSILLSHSQSSRI